MKPDMTYCIPSDFQHDVCSSCARRVTEDKAENNILWITNFIPRHSRVQGWVCTGQIEKDKK